MFALSSEDSFFAKEAWWPVPGVFLIVSVRPRAGL